MNKEKRRHTVSDIKDRKGGKKIVCLTAYTAPMAQILDRHADLLLVGDSIGNVLYGMENTLGVDLDIMIRHGQAVMRTVSKACVVIDMPFGSYEESHEQAYRNATRIMKETGCDAVKLEGGQNMAGTIEYLTSRNIPVMAHIGLLPQSVLKDGGYKVKGKTKEDEARLTEDARAVEKAGAFAIVIEGTVADVAAQMTKAVSIPTIGIGAGLNCDGQVLVTEDMLGLSGGHVPKFVRQYAALGDAIDRAAAEYAKDVQQGTFPAQEHVYTRPVEVVKNSKNHR